MPPEYPHELDFGCDPYPVNNQFLADAAVDPGFCDLKSRSVPATAGVAILVPVINP
jgi:hypothetical protein